jgi:hypothetical protein
LNSEVLPLFGVPTRARCIKGASMLPGSTRLKRDDFFGMNRHRALACCWGMISSE